MRTYIYHWTLYSVQIIHRKYLYRLLLVYFLFCKKAVLHSIVGLMDTVGRRVLVKESINTRQLF